MKCVAMAFDLNSAPTPAPPRPIAATQQQQATVASAQWPEAGGGGDAESGMWVLRDGRGALRGLGGRQTPGIGMSHGGERELGCHCVFLNVYHLLLTPRSPSLLHFCVSF